MLILGIETSCDETAASLIEAKNGQITVLSDIVSSQVKLHAKWGGVVPNLAAREHTKNIIPVIREALEKSGKNPKEIDLLATTNGPGLMPALIVGAQAAKALALVWQKPLMGIHHIEGHIYANFINQNFGSDKIKFPAISLVISGGHTQLILMKEHLKYEIIGETQDDAVGEAFDKVARILGLGYPGGPIIAEEAEKYSDQKTKTDVFDFSFPRPMINSKDLNFSFSGLKTAVLYLTKKNSSLLEEKMFIQKVAFEFQNAVSDVLISKTISAVKKYQPKTVLISGGVSANQEIRQNLEKSLRDNFPQINYLAPEKKYTGDNATMIAVAAFFRFQKMSSSEKNGLSETWKNLEIKADLKLQNL